VRFPTSGTGTVFSRNYTTPAYSASPYGGSLSAYDGRSIKLRWRLSTDGGLTRAGWWVDDIKVTNALIPTTCSSGIASSPREVAPDGDPMACSRSGPDSTVRVSYAPACGTLDNTVYWGTGPISGAVGWTNAACAMGNTGEASFDPGDPPPGAYYYFVLVGQSATKEGSYGRGRDGASRPERPEASGIGACDKPLDLSGVCP